MNASPTLGVERRAAGCRVVVHGQGTRPFVGLHGWSGSSASFDPLVRFLPAEATLYAFDLPGVGGSARPTEWTAEGLTDRLAEAIDALGLDRVEVIAACGGACPAMRLSSRQPERFERLVLVDPFAFVPWYFRIFLLPVLGPALYRLTFANPFGRALTDGALGGRRPAGVSLTEGFAEVSHEENYRLLRALCDGVSVPLEQQAKFRGPVEIIHGESTFSAVLDSVDRFREVWPKLTVFAIAGAGHVPMHEQSEQVANLAFAPSTPLRALGG